MIRDAELGEQNAKLDNMILELRQELAESIFKLRSGILTPKNRFTSVIIIIYSVIRVLRTQD